SGGGGPADRTAAIGHGGYYGGGAGGTIGALPPPSGGPGIIVITYESAFAASCTVSLTPSTINEGDSATLTWTSSYAEDVYIEHVGYVGASGSFSVSPSETTNYRCYADGPGGSD